MRREFGHEFEWPPGSIPVRNSRSTWQVTKNDYHGRRRLMHRIGVNGPQLNAWAIFGGPAMEDFTLLVSRRLDAGTVWIDKHLELALNIPFGGAKFSGLGTELGEESLAELTRLQAIKMAR